MATILDTGALVRPAFTAADFTATKWDTSENRAKFANNLCRFIASDFKTTMFTDKLYRRLAMMFGTSRTTINSALPRSFSKTFAERSPFSKRPRCGGRAATPPGRTPTSSARS